MISNLPDKMLIQIFSHLLPCTLHTVASISTQFANITKRLGACRLDFSDFADTDQFTDTKNTNKMIARIKKDIRTEAMGALIRHILVISNRLIPNNVFLYIQQRCPNVISFDYDRELLDATMTHSTFHTLQRHPFYSFGWRHSIAHLPACHHEQQRWWEDETFCRRLETVYLRAGDFLLRYYQRRLFESTTTNNNGYDTTPSFHLPPLPRLHVLTLHVPSLVLDKNTMDTVIHQQCPRLTHLALRKISLDGRRNHVANVPPHPNLKVLVLEYVAFLDLGMYTDLPHKYPNLQSLTLILSTNQNKTIDKQHYIVGTIKRIYDMIVRFHSLNKLIVHLEGFGPQQDDPVDPWFQQKMQHYFSKPSTKHIDCRITYGVIQQKPKKIESVWKSISKSLLSRQIHK